MSYNVIPVTKATTRTREHAPISASFLPSSGALVVVFAPEFLKAEENTRVVSIGSKVICGYDDSDNSMIFAPAKDDQKFNTRKVCRRQGFPGAGHIVIPARNLPEALVARGFEGRKAMDWKVMEDGAVVVQF